MSYTTDLIASMIRHRDECKRLALFALLRFDFSERRHFLSEAKRFDQWASELQAARVRA